MCSSCQVLRPESVSSNKLRNLTQSSTVQVFLHGNICLKIIGVYVQNEKLGLVAAWATEGVQGHPGEFSWAPVPK